MTSTTAPGYSPAARARVIRLARLSASNRQLAESVAAADDASPILSKWAAAVLSGGETLFDQWRQSYLGQ